MLEACNDPYPPFWSHQAALHEHVTHGMTTTMLMLLQDVRDIRRVPTLLP